MSIQKKHIPNILLILRIVFSIAIFILFILICTNNDTKIVYDISPKRYNEIWVHGWLLLIIGILFTIASVTDWLDGYLARKYKWVSDFGKLWDPIADKILINITLIGLMILGCIPWWLVVIMVTRDTIVDASRMYAASKGKVVAADVYGKAKTIFQMLGIILILFFFDERSSSFAYNTCSKYYWGIQNLVIYIATLFSLISGINYLIKIHKPKTTINK